jgi:predicted component of type VI protein secretion system
MTGRACAVLCAALLLIAAGCGKRKTTSRAKAPDLTIRVSTDKATNEGRPLHMLVRVVELKTFVEESYATVAPQVVAPDDSVLGQSVIYPGREAVVGLDLPALEERQSIAVYFLFTEPETPWKLRLSDTSTGRVDVTLGERRIAAPE